MDPKFLNWHLDDNLTEAEKFSLVKVMEEAAEMQQAAAKILTWGWDNWDPTKPSVSNTVQFIREWRDLAAAVERLKLPKAPELLGWFDIREVAPSPREVVLVMGDSGSSVHPIFVCAAYYDADYRPHSPWQSVNSDSLSDSGWEPTHWRTIEDLI